MSTDVRNLDNLSILLNKGIPLRCGPAVSIILVNICFTNCKKYEGFMETVRPDNSPVEVTAILIECDMDDIQRNPNSKDSRFQREELFKHNALQNCDKKLVLTIKLTSESASSADEYVPIDHVAEGRLKNRVRLLQPYVLRVRRDAPLEAYKLKFIETVSGILTMTNDQNDNYIEEFPKRILRNTEALDSMKDWRSESQYPVPASHSPQPYPMPTSAGPLVSQSSDCNGANVKTITRENISKCTKRRGNNFLIRDERNTQRYGQFIEASSNNEHLKRKKHPETEPGEDEKIFKNNKGNIHKSRKIHDNLDASEKEFALYEIGSPILWFNVGVNLFEKLSTNTGKILWNDITKGESIRVSSVSPEWTSSDMTVHFKPIDFIPRKDFLLPKANLSLLIPLVEKNVNTIPNNIFYSHDMSVENKGGFILVPSEDVLEIKATNILKRTLPNISTETTNKNIRRVVVRATKEPRKVLGGKLEVVTLGSDKYLTLMHGGKCYAQADVEVRADDNQLVHVSAPGRIAIIVADNINGKRSTLTVQATNTGLFAGPYRVQVRECDSGLLNLTHNQSIMSVPIMLPPRHTRRFMLQLPGPPATERPHCLGDDPKLLCQDMSAARQDASGLPPRAIRLARSYRYTDVTAVNLAVVIIGVIGMLLFLGVLKGLLGLIYPRAGVWGLDHILATPWQLDCYYERRLRCREVSYDDNCWPVHPDTRERTVRVVSLPVEFILNVVFFVVTPGLIMVDAFKELPKCTAVGGRIKSPVSRTPNISHRDVQMFPLLNAHQRLRNLDLSHTSGSDSEQEDTAFVLSQIKKSSESLANNQLKHSNTGEPSEDTEMQSLKQTNLEVIKPQVTDE